MTVQRYTQNTEIGQGRRKKKRKTVKGARRTETDDYMNASGLTPLAKEIDNGFLFLAQPYPDQATPFDYASTGQMMASSRAQDR